MSKILRIFACFVSLFFVVSANAAYDCPTLRKYTSCNAGYYLNGTVSMQ